MKDDFSDLYYSYLGSKGNEQKLIKLIKSKLILQDNILSDIFFGWPSDTTEEFLIEDGAQRDVYYKTGHKMTLWIELKGEEKCGLIMLIYRNDKGLRGRDF